MFLLAANIRIVILISIKFVPKGSIDNKSAFYVMFGRIWGLSSLTYIGAHLPRWVYTLRGGNCRQFADDIFKCIFVNYKLEISLNISLKFGPKVRINDIPALVSIMAWCQAGDNSSSEPMAASLMAHICITRPQWVNILRSIVSGNVFFVLPWSCLERIWLQMG